MNLFKNFSIKNWLLIFFNELLAALKLDASPKGGWNPETDLSLSGNFLRNKIIEINFRKYDF